MKKLFTIFSLVLFVNITNAQFYQQSPKLLPSGIPAGGAFGWACDISDDASTAVIGAPGTNGDNGSTIIYNRSGSAWSQGTVLHGTGNTGGANQGQSVAISADGNTVVTGGPSDNTNAGAAWIFTRSGGVWSQQGSKLVGTGAVGSIANQAYHVAISADGNTVLLGAPNDNGQLGAAWVFTRSGSTWTQQGAKLSGTGAVSSSGFPARQGANVALSGDGNTAIICGYGDAGDIGAVWVFTRSGSTWTQQGTKLTATGAVSGFPNFGTAAAASTDGNTIIVGAAGDNLNIGGAFVFTRSGTTWSQQGSELIGTASVNHQQQGCSVDISGSGNTAVIGGGMSVLSGLTSDYGVGSAWVFTRSGTSWSQLGSKWVGSFASGNSQQGFSVAITTDGNTFIVGGANDNTATGAVWVYSKTLPIAAVPSLSGALQAAAYPNPTNKEITIDFKNAINETMTIRIFDALGHVVSERVVDGSSSVYTENVSRLAQGVYVMNIITESKGEEKYVFVKE